MFRGSAIGNMRCPQCRSEMIKTVNEILGQSYQCKKCHSSVDISFDKMTITIDGKVKKYDEIQRNRLEEAN